MSDSKEVKFDGIGTLAMVLLVLGLAYLHVNHPGDSLITDLLWLVIILYVIFVAFILGIMVLIGLAVMVG